MSRDDGFFFGTCRLGAALSAVGLWVATLFVAELSALWVPALLLVSALVFYAWRQLRRDVVAATVSAVALAAGFVLGPFMASVVAAVAAAVVMVIFAPMLFEFVVSFAADGA